MNVFFKLRFHKKKWLVYCSYDPNKYNISRHADKLRKGLDLYSAYYKNIILLGVFNISIDDIHMESFCGCYRFKSLIKDPTCFKNPGNPSSIDLMLTNSPYSFQNSCVIETSLSYFHEIIVSVMKTTFQKLKPRIVQCRDYTQFSNDNFRKKVLENLSLETRILTVMVLMVSIQIALRKKTYFAIICYFFNKELTSAHKKLTQLRNRYLK